MDPRQRNTRHLATAQEPQKLEFAGPKLEEAFRYGPAPLLLHGAYNSAKTVTACLKTLVISDMYPGYRWFVGRKVWDELRKTTMSSFFKFCPRSAWEPYGRRSDTEKYLELNNGSSYIWGHLDDPDTLTIVRGLEINGFLLDQAEELEEEIFTALLPRLGRWDRVTVPDAVREEYERTNGRKWPWIHHVTGKVMPPSYALLTCNPEHELHWLYPRFDADDQGHWEKRLLVENEPRLLADGTYAPVGSRISYHDMGYKMIELSAYDNKYATRQSLEQMESQDETWKRRFLYGKKGIPEGQIHHVRDESLLEPTAVVLTHIMQRCTLHRSMDHGDSAPTCVLWWGIDQDGNVFCFREYYQPNKLISEHRQNIAALSKSEFYQLQLADPAIFSASMQKHDRRWSVAEEYGDCVNMPRETAIFWDKGDNDELGTRNRISEYLKPSGVWVTRNGELVEEPRIHPITKERGLWPRLFFVKKTQDYPNGCDQAIRQLKSARREKIGTENGRPIFSDERDPKIPDHAFDCLHGDTQVYTFKGSYAIRGLVGTTGLVLSPNGWVPYRDCEKYRENSEMVSVEFSDGRTVVCTPDHLFLTISGWCRADALQGRIVCDIVSQWKLSKLTRRSSRLTANGTTGAASTFSATASDSIARYGSITTGQFQMDGTSTTSTRTGQITRLATSRSSTHTTTYRFTPKDGLTPRLYWQCKRKLRNGIEVLKAASGIVNRFVFRLGRRASETLIKVAPYVGGISSLPEARLAIPSFAQMPARAKAEGAQESMTWIASAQDAAFYLEPASTRAENIVRVVAVTSAASADSYCLTVDDPIHAFVVEDGIPVHNCVRYLMAAQPPLPNAVQRKYSAASFFGRRNMALMAKRKGNMAKEAKRQYERMYG